MREKMNQLRRAEKFLEALAYGKGAYAQDASSALREIMVLGEERRAEDPQFSLDCYTFILEKEPQNVQGLKSAGLAHNALFQPEEAKTFLSQAIEYGDQSNETRYALSVAKNLLGDFSGAFKEADQTTRQDKNFAPGYFGAGYALGALGRLDEALQLYEGGLGILPTHPFGLLGKANILNRLNRQSEALRVFQSVGELPGAVVRLIQKAKEKNPAYLLPGEGIAVCQSAGVSPKP